MKRDLRMTRPLNSSFLNCERDIALILKKLFIESRPYSEELIKLLVINAKDCLDNNTSEVYKKAVQRMSLAKLREEGYIRLEPKLSFGEGEEVKSYILISMDNFTPNATNPEFRDNIISFDIICHFDQWQLQDFQLRPYKIAAEIDSMFNEQRLTGIGTLQFLGANQIVLNDEFAGLSLMYQAIHGEEDKKGMLNPAEQEEFEIDFDELFK